MTPSIRVLLIAVAALLHGCATLSEGQCRQADWRALGLQDGREGRPESRLHDHREACARFAVAPQERAYLEGRDDGLDQYCEIGNGYRVGRRGGRYAGVCPAAVEPAFLAHYERGYEIHEVEQALADLDRRIQSLEGALARRELSTEQREHYRHEVYRLHSEFAALRHYGMRLEEAYRLGRRAPQYAPGRRF